MLRKSTRSLVEIHCKKIKITSVHTWYIWVPLRTFRSSKTLSMQVMRRALRTVNFLWNVLCRGRIVFNLICKHKKYYFHISFVATGFRLARIIYNGIIYLYYILFIVGRIITVFHGSSRAKKYIVFEVNFNFKHFDAIVNNRTFVSCTTAANRLCT